MAASTRSVTIDGAPFGPITKGVDINGVKFVIPPEGSATFTWNRDEIDVRNLATINIRVPLGAGSGGLEGTYNASDSGLGGFDKFTVKYPAGTVDTNDANAVANELQSGRAAYVKGQKVTGNLPAYSSIADVGAVTSSTSSNYPDSFRFYWKNATKKIIVADSTINTYVAKSEFGNARMANVEKGFYFTSANGFNAAGNLLVPLDVYGGGKFSHSVSGDFSVTFVPERFGAYRQDNLFWCLKFKNTANPSSGPAFKWGCLIISAALYNSGYETIRHEVVLSYSRYEDESSAYTISNGFKPGDVQFDRLLTISEQSGQLGKMLYFDFKQDLLLGANLEFECYQMCMK